MAFVVQSEATLLTAESNPYEMNGNSGVSHKIRLFAEGEVYECKSTAEQVLALKKFEGMKGTGTFSIQSKKERLSIKLEAFEA